MYTLSQHGELKIRLMLGKVLTLNDWFIIKKKFDFNAHNFDCQTSPTGISIS